MSDGNQRPSNGMPQDPDVGALNILMMFVNFFKWLFTTDSGRGFLLFFVGFCLVAGILGWIVGPAETNRSGYSGTTVQDSRPSPEPMRFHGNDGRQIIQVPRSDAPVMQIPQGATGGCITVNNMTECSWTRGR